MMEAPSAEVVNTTAPADGPGGGSGRRLASLFDLAAEDISPSCSGREGFPPVTPIAGAGAPSKDPSAKASDLTTPTGVTELGIGGGDRKLEKLDLSTASEVANAPNVPADGSKGARRLYSDVATEEPSVHGDDFENDIPAALPRFTLYQSLAQNLSEEMIDRISFYSIIYDINKEASEMADNDSSTFHVEGESSMHDLASIDEEQWVLSVIEDISPALGDPARACPASFREAIGEIERPADNVPLDCSSPNPLSSLASRKTQLWKPSRSWWEARSGKNPWIEPKSHARRWRYLWPLIHYHKFLAKCIKKLKRSGVDCQTSTEPATVFLREEVCYVSDHLALVSKFTAEDWLSGLYYFEGWADTSTPAAFDSLRAVITKQKLRSISDQDLNSSLVSSQIDKHYKEIMRLAEVSRNKQLLANAQAFVPSAQSVPEYDVIPPLGYHDSMIGQYYGQFQGGGYMHPPPSPAYPMYPYQQHHHHHHHHQNQAGAVPFHPTGFPMSPAGNPIPPPPSPVHETTQAAPLTSSGWPPVCGGYYPPMGSDFIPSQIPSELYPPSTPGGESMVPPSPYWERMAMMAIATPQAPRVRPLPTPKYPQNNLRTPSRGRNGQQHQNAGCVTPARNLGSRGPRSRMLPPDSPFTVQWPSLGVRNGKPPPSPATQFFASQKHSGNAFFNMGGANGIPPSTPTYHLGDKKGIGENDCALPVIEDQGFLRFPFPPSPMSDDRQQSSGTDLPSVAKVDVENSANDS